MKRILSALLLLTVIVSLACPAFAGERMEIRITDAIAEAALPREVKLPAAPKRSTQEDNLVFPGPLCSGLGIQKGYSASLHLVTYQTGKANQYACILIFKGKGTSGEPIHTDYKLFDTAKGFSSLSFSWNCENQPAGAYTLVSCTSEVQGNFLVPVDGTVVSEYIYITTGSTKVWNYFIEDWETGKRLDAINVSCDETKFVAWGRSPKPSRPYGSMEANITNGIADVQYEAGLFIITPKKCGYGWLRLRLDDAMYAFPVNVCISDKGHKYTESVVARENGLYDEGVNVHYCEACDEIIRETTYSKSEDFKRFKDLDAYAWYYDYVKEAFYQNLFKGISFYQFKPDDTMTRAMVVTVLWRNAGEPEAQEADFVDVNPKQWYGKAVSWAAENGIVNGVGKGKFDPDGEVTREQLATILYRYARFLEIDLSSNEALQRFEDENRVQSWSYDALRWAVGYGLITGSSKGDKLYLLPQDGATRAQVSAILVRFMEKLDALKNAQASLDLTDAIDSGECTTISGTLQWAYYEDQTLRFAGTGNIPNAQENQDSFPWEKYRAEVRRIEVLSAVTGLRESAFSDYPNLESVWLADSATAINRSAFANCTALREVRLSPNYTSIGNTAFMNCESLESIELPQKLDSLGYGAFMNCTSLKEIVVPDSIIVNMASAGMYAVGTIGSEVFSGCTALERVVLPVALTDIPDLLFTNCTSLKEVVLPVCVSYLGEGLFYGCTSMESFVVPYKVRVIRLGMFTGCTSMKEVFVLNPDAYFEDQSMHLEVELDKLPFGDPAQVVVYGFLGTELETATKAYGYTYEDIEAYLQ